VERLRLDGQLVERLELERVVLVGQLVERLELERFELERQQLVGWGMARGELGLIDTGRYR
jgi:hypothetical protein